MLVAPTSDELVAERCRRKLGRFVREAWPLVEPGTPFVSNWHIDAICEHLEAVSRREIRRLLINIPPRCMKSLAVCVFWPCWEWLDRPETKWLFASYAQTLSTRDSLKCRRLLKTRGIRGDDGRERGTVERLGYRGLLELLHGPDAWTLSDDQDAKQRFDNTRKGYRLATSVGGVGTGEGGDIIVIDDAHKADEAESDTVRQSVLDWHDGTIPTRFNQPKTGAEVAIMQRLHEQDLAGHLLELGGWEHLCLPMEYERKHPFVWPDDPRKRDGALLWAERVGPAELHTMRRDLGGYRAAGQLQQRPAPAEGLLFKRKHFRTWRLAVDETQGAATKRTYLLDTADGVKHVDTGLCRVFQTVDCAASDKTTADYTVIATWAVTPGKDLLLLEVERQRFDVLDVDGFLARKNDEHGGPPLWLEEFGAGKGPFKALRRKGRPVMALQPEQGTQLDKIARAWPAVAAYEAHEIYHPPEAHTQSWNEPLSVFEGELLAFPNARNDDQVDVVSYAARVAPRAGGQQQTQQRDAGPRPHTGGVMSQQF